LLLINRLIQKISVKENAGAMFYGRMVNHLGIIENNYSRLDILIFLKKDKTVGEVFKITSNIKKYSYKMYEDLIHNFRNMSTGGDGGPYMIGYRWTSVREYHYMSWTNAMFSDLLERLEDNEV